jgi:type I restriction enzyme M protein
MRTGQLENGMATAKKTGSSEEPIEKQLWKAADKLRKNIDAAEYKHIVLGLIFLKYISDAFEDLFNKLKQGEGDYAGADPEDKDEYRAEIVFLCQKLRGGHICNQKPNCRILAGWLIRRWMPLKRTIRC